jgi:hypothetical protein
MRADEAVNACFGDPLARFVSALGASTPEEAMRLSCQRVLDENGQEHGPVPLGRLISTLGARRADLSLPTLGRLRVDKDGYLICVRIGTPWRQARFTVAH